MHSLSIDPSVRPVIQRRRKMNEERANAAKDEVDRLLRIGFIREVQYPKWISNPVLVKKSNGKWRMCIDFKDLNKACPKDSYPLPSIDGLVDATAGHGALSFLDAYSGYNQVVMDPRDEECTAFITNQGTFCYKVMPFGLKNAGATFMRLVHRVFCDQLGKTVSAYVDDIVVRSSSSEEHIHDLGEVFDTLRKFRLSLNPEKCVFGVSSGKFLGFLISARGIDVNPEKIMAVVNMRSPRSRNEVQRLNGAVNYLSRFCSRLAERSLPFFAALKKTGNFAWTEEMEKAFQQLKAHLSSLPTLSPPKGGEDLQLYLAIGPATVSAVLTREAKYPVYFVSRVLQPVEQRYSPVEKIALAVVSAARRLRPYFQAHTIQVLSDLPLRQILHQPALSGRMTKWAVELSEFDISYLPRSSIKAQCLADFVAETTFGDEECQSTESWRIFVDGARCEAGGGAGVVLEGPSSFSHEYALNFAFPVTNNEAEYEALIAGIEMALLNGARRVKAFTDSEIVARQVTGEYEAKAGMLPAYCAKVKALVSSLDKFADRKYSANREHSSRRPSQNGGHLTKRSGRPRLH